MENDSYVANSSKQASGRPLLTHNIKQAFIASDGKPLAASCMSELIQNRMDGRVCGIMSVK